MPIGADLLTVVTTASPREAWEAVSADLWRQFSAPIGPGAADAEIVRRDKDLNQLDNVISGSCWELWAEFETCIPKASASLVEFWHSNPAGRAVLILDGLSLREAPWLLSEAARRGFNIRERGCRGSELPPETTPFAKALGFSQRSSLENNGAGSAHKLTGAATDSCELGFRDCVDLVGSQTGFVFWHHWPDVRTHDLAGPGISLQKLAKEAHQKLTSDDFWALIERLATGRRLAITGDHGYAASGHFHDIADKDQAAHMKTVFKNGRSAPGTGAEGPWVPPLDLRLGAHQFVLGRRKWKGSSGYPTLQHGGLSLLEVFVPFIELSK